MVEYKTHPVYTNYEIGSDGSVFSLNYRSTGVKRKINPILMNTGYTTIAVTENKKEKNFLFIDWWHRFILKTH